jgi:hypothetical protein
MVWFTLALLLPTATGFVLCSAFWRRSQGLMDWLTRLFVGLGVGAGLSSCMFYFELLTGSRTRTDLLLLDSLLLAVAGAVLLVRRRFRSVDEFCELQAASPHASLIAYLLAVPMVVAASIAFRYSIRYAASHPHGTWDSWAIWTFRARFIFRSGAQWRDAFSSVIGYSHPDYPLLLPASIDRLWTYLQHEALLVPTMLGFFFMWCTVGLAMSSVAMLRSKSQALLVGAVLVTTPFFVKHAVSGYAESPLMFFFLATTVLLIMSESTPQMLVLAGLTAGLAAWTKNEGLLFLVSCGTSLTAMVFFARGWAACIRTVSLFAAGVFPVLAVIILFKSQVHVGNWLFEPDPGGGTVLERIATLGRYSMISRYYLGEISGFGEWQISMVPVLGIYYLLLGRLRGVKQKPGLLTAMGTLAGTLVGSFLVFVITPSELQWQLTNSLNRIFLQLWPAAVVVFFCLTRTPEEALAVPGVRVHRIVPE